MSLYAPQIYTPSGMTDRNVFVNGEKVLHIGSGSRRLPGAETVDILALPGVDRVHDLDVYPWPYSDASFDVVFAHNVLEHLDDTIAAMEELWRILRPGGRLIVTVPYFRSVDAFGDVTHRHFFTSESMDTFVQGASRYGYTDRMFTKIGFWFGWPHPSRNPVTRLVKKLMHRYWRAYDSHVSLVAPVKVLIWELEKKA